MPVYQALEMIPVAVLTAPQMYRLLIVQTLTRLYTIFHQFHNVTKDIVTLQRLNHVVLMNHQLLVDSHVKRLVSLFLMLNLRIKFLSILNLKFDLIFYRMVQLHTQHHIQTQTYKEHH